MKGPPPDLNILIAKADAKAASGDIDPTHNLSRQKVYLFHGYNDAVVAKSVTDAAADFYLHYLGNAARNLYYQTALGAGHSLVVLQKPEVKGLNDCNENESPYIDSASMRRLSLLLCHAAARSCFSRMSLASTSVPANRQHIGAGECHECLKVFTDERRGELQFARTLTKGRAARGVE